MTGRRPVPRKLPRVLPGLVALLAACAEPAAVPPVPQPTVASVADPMRQAVIGAAFAFSDTTRLAGRPADAARAAAQLEWMAVALAQDQWWIGAVPTLFFQLRDAGEDLRGAIGLAPQASAVVVTRSLGEAAGALDRGDRAAAAAALAPVAPAGGEAALARLYALPALPRAAAATRFAEQEMMRIMTSDPL